MQQAKVHLFSFAPRAYQRDGGLESARHQDPAPAIEFETRRLLVVAAHIQARAGQFFDRQQKLLLKLVGDTTRFQLQVSAFVAGTVALRAADSALAC